MKHIPNILSTIRLLMIPIFVVSYFKFSPLVATLIYVAAWLTDALDGYLARRNNWITDLGKFLDPLADKLMQIAAAVCFTVDNLLFLAVLIPLLLKELAMLIGGVLIIKRNKVVAQANWYGKLATIVIFVCAFLRLLIRNSLALDITVCALILFMLIFSLLMYYFKVFRGKYNETIRKQ